MSVDELFRTYKEFGYGGLLVMLVFFTGRYLLRQNKACYDKYETHMNNSKGDIKSLTVQMFSVVEKNTAATTALSKTMTDIYISKLKS